MPLMFIRRRVTVMCLSDMNDYGCELLFASVHTVFRFLCSYKSFVNSCFLSKVTFPIQSSFSFLSQNSLRFVRVNGREVSNLLFLPTVYIFYFLIYVIWIGRHCDGEENRAPCFDGFARFEILSKKETLFFECRLSVCLSASLPVHARADFSSLESECGRIYSYSAFNNNRIKLNRIK